ncbi:MAG: metallophosphoesterase [Candidatus Aenigmarchaeota archaeon]|nr:metallophosphoesterase [Candidatus Aenigmarchaeota archaeon]
MATQQLKMVEGKPAILLGKALVIADLHLGIEKEFREAGIRMPSRTRYLAGKVLDMLQSTKAAKLIILGDVKHHVTGISYHEMREIPEFFRLLDGYDIEIIPGNHDGAIGKVAGNVQVGKPEGFLLGRYYLLHGQAWPAHSCRNAEMIITGHVHPELDIIDSLGHRWREPAWVLARLNGSFRRRYRCQQEISMLVMPAFNELVGSRGIKMEAQTSPLMKHADLERAEIFLTDGTLIGTAGKINQRLGGARRTPRTPRK